MPTSNTYIDANGETRYKVIFAPHVLPRAMRGYYLTMAEAQLFVGFKNLIDDVEDEAYVKLSTTALSNASEAELKFLNKAFPHLNIERTGPQTVIYSTKN